MINAHWLFPDGVASYWVARIVKIPLVLSAHGCDINHYLKMPFRKIQIMPALKGCRKITVVSAQQKECLVSQGIVDRKLR